MSLGISIDPTMGYLGDGIYEYWDWDVEDTDDNEDYWDYGAKDVITKENETQIAMAEEVRFSKSFLSSEAYRSHHFFDILTSNLTYIVNRYCRYEDLSKDYAEVAMQKNVLKDIVFVHAIDLGINPTLNHIKNLDDIVSNIYSNTNRKSVYNRVGALQYFLHKCILNGGKTIDHLDREVMRRLLSLSRLHIAISDIRKKNFDIIKDELIQNYMDSKESSPAPYVEMLNRQYIKNWKKRHLRSLLHFCPQIERNTLKRLLNLKQPFNNEAVLEVLFSEK